MRERPILFSGSNVCAILEGRKTQTRRLIKPQPPALGEKQRPHKFAFTTDDEGVNLYVHSQSAGAGNWIVRYPFGQPGERLWVRETGLWANLGFESHVAYRANGEPDNSWSRPVKWRPSIYMPRWASRITLEVTGVRVERLVEISEADAIAEGVEIEVRENGALEPFRRLWDSINVKRAPWASNPYVWVIEFKRITP